MGFQPPCSPDDEKKALSASQALIHDADFKARHREKPTHFTRSRRLLFPVMLLLMLRKGVKSLQLTLNEWFDGLDAASVTASAFSQARHRLRHTAFIELNREAVVKACYEDGGHRLHRGFRLLAIDGSTIRLPDFPDVAGDFGEIRYAKGEAVAGARAYGIASVPYDVLNGPATWS